ncbi:magnesium/cobalt transporter CorA [Saprospira sp. CCB-QB6]|uniref:magnesium/cobalt transporter CorA n=1 Tax=Saprospira sp. CCB-QB6 TaxID=3023936 RepID=UPI002349FF4F|nr:magnesium/cobalt transporter CorA [Saprospira sp. CCB-QB6]WCL82893.1 magnesium/cobalt transporter CorA [Saprospira sp. CCB-QB6]
MIDLIAYNAAQADRKELRIAELEGTLPEFIETQKWLNVNVPQDKDLGQLSLFFNLHHLTQEDICATEDLPKIEAFEEYLFLSLKMLSLNAQKKLEVEHLSFVLKKDALLSFQERPGDVFEDIRDRIFNNKGFLRKRRLDYLFTRLIDVVVDHYGFCLEDIRQEIVELEIRLLDQAIDNKGVIQEIMRLKKQLNRIRSLIWPLRELLNRIKSEGTSFFHKSSFAYLNDIQDHLQYQLSAFDNLREMLKDLMDLHNAQLSNDMNQVMKTLTIISALFIPLTFLAGIYGMNFDYMPETKWPWAYPSLLGLMLIITAFLIYFMRRRNWF